MKSSYLVWGGIAVVALVIGGAIYWKNNRPGPLDGFAQCLADKGALFYGAYWCPNCTTQKKMFENSERLLPYVECANPGGKGQKRLCDEKGVEAYPTWTFADGTRDVGVLSLAELAEKSGCTIPEKL